MRCTAYRRRGTGVGCSVVQAFSLLHSFIMGVFKAAISRSTTQELCALIQFMVVRRPECIPVAELGNPGAQNGQHCPSTQGELDSC